MSAAALSTLKYCMLRLAICNVADEYPLIGRPMTSSWYWCPIIDLATGRIINWKQGVRASISYKVVDEFSCEIKDSDNAVVASYEGYVPSFMAITDEGYGDYIYLDIDENQIIQDVKFKTFGCGAAVATSSMATELVKGKTIYEALKVTNKAVMEALDGLPPVKVHCSLLAEEAIHAALWDYAEKNGITIEGLEKPKSDIHEDEEEESEEY